MLEESELIRLFLGIAAAVILGMSRGGLKRLSGHKIFIAAYLVLLAGWLFTVVEHAVFPEIFNLLEHAAYVASGVLYLLWCIRLVKGAAR
jgi:hypothetical protein